MHRWDSNTEFLPNKWKFAASSQKDPTQAAKSCSFAIAQLLQHKQLKVVYFRKLHSLAFVTSVHIRWSVFRCEVCQCKPSGLCLKANNSCKNIKIRLIWKLGKLIYYGTCENTAAHQWPPQHWCPSPQFSQAKLIRSAYSALKQLIRKERTGLILRGQDIHTAGTHGHVSPGSLGEWIAQFPSLNSW